MSPRTSGPTVTPLQVTLSVLSPPPLSSPLMQTTPWMVLRVLVAGVAGALPTLHDRYGISRERLAARIKGWLG